MATVIRFARHGTKKKPFYKIVVQDSRSPRDGKFIEKVGSFDPVNKDALMVSRERLSYWLGTGAQMSDAVKKRVRLQLKEWGMGATAPTAAPVKAAPQDAPKEAKKPAKAAAPKAKKAKTKEA